MNLQEYGEVIENYDLINNNTYRLHSICNYFIKVKNITKLTNLIKYLNDKKEKYLIIGNGSNIILPPKYNGTVIKLSLEGIKQNGNELTVPSSIMMPVLCLESVNRGLKGLEWSSGIPGTLGASIIGNAGAYNDEISNYIKEIEVLENNKVKILKRSDLFFSYRSSNLKTRDIIILNATLTLEPGDKNESLELIKNRKERRINSQPLNYPNNGSVFRNPEGQFAGKLIEDAGLKGYTIGGAKISEKHANFIINYNNATYEDIVSLIRYTQIKIKEIYNIDLILEQIIID